ncbi:hypothetical protein C479_08163 [Halovivax asiaticus JCM 14624]|uniref:HTH arsR-type domain-containing protein n=1 Tax=Halovivax asiaticus JCM 14624 TaxID=1227490 RepID=M0BIT3_9EURY|nr:helix-turn-helix domain-containing protein [Halovivax asiaticus]ELZ10770.1 hypothetical protein C479_08163 [Halovivax asiaticus JCM 14624]
MTGDERLRATVSALDDPTCRAILEALDEPTAAATLAERCDVSSSTVYRKLERLQRAGLVERRVVIRADFSQTVRYATTFDEISIGVDDLRAAQLAADGR